MVIVLTENSGASHITLAAPIKLMGALGLKIKLNTFLGTPP